MKIISYNINRCTQEKIDSLLSRQADLYILPEMAEPRLLSFSDCFEAKWTGDYPQKGLGVIYKKTLNIDDAPIEVDQNYFIPLIVNDRLIVAAWPTKQGVSEKLSYPKITMLAFEQLAPLIAKLPTIISGDFNCYKGQSGQTKNSSIEAIDNFLQQHGLHSLYHRMSGESIGEESICTYHHLFKKEKNMEFFIDYTYTNMKVADFRIEPWDPNISDHCAQTIVI